MRYRPGARTGPKSPTHTVRMAPRMSVATVRTGGPPRNATEPSPSLTTSKSPKACGELNSFRIDGAYPTCDAARRPKGGSSDTATARNPQAGKPSTRLPASFKRPRAPRIPAGMPTAAPATAARALARLLPDALPVDVAPYTIYLFR